LKNKPCGPESSLEHPSTVNELFSKCLELLSELYPNLELWQIKIKKNFQWVSAVAVRGEIGREGCEISSLVEHMGLSPWLFL